MPNIDDQFDLIFIDGWHTFDNVMVDIFYSINLLKPGGYIILDDADFPSVGKAISYFIKLPNIKFEKELLINFKSASYKRKIGLILRQVLNERLAQIFLPKFLFDKFFYQLSGTMIILKKLGQDNRPWDYHKIF